MDLAVDQAGRAAHADCPQPRRELSGLGLKPVDHIAEQAALLVSRGCGRILVEAGRLVAVTGRWWPYIGNEWRASYDRHARPLPTDRCELYYRVPWRQANFLTLTYVRSGPRTSLSSLYAATLVLDEIARLKSCDAIVCNVSNSRISHRLMLRWGWQQHCLQWRGRHYIKRFYGVYPRIPAFWRQRLTLDATSKQGI